MTLKEFLVERGIAQRSIARQLGMSAAMFNECLSGKKQWSAHAIKYLPVVLPADTPKELIVELRLSRSKRG